MVKSGFIGRRSILMELESRFHDNKADLVVLYGRRRVGKSRLIHEFIKDKRNTFFFTGVETSQVEADNSQNHRQIQIAHFLATLAEISGNKALNRQGDPSWEEVFSHLDKSLPSNDLPCCLIFDEFPWMAGQRLELVRTLFKFWELKWSQRKNLLLFVCGSSVGFLERHFVHSTQFYGRSSLTIHLSPLTFFEAKHFFGSSRSAEEALEFYMTFGGIPKYLEQITKSDSVRKTINRLCFTPNSLFSEEVPHLLKSSFMRESDKYQKIIQSLTRHDSLSYEELAKKTKSAKGSSLKHLIQNLEYSDMIDRFTPMDRFGKTNLFRFRLSDEFMRFYYIFMDPNTQLIRENKNQKDIYDIIISQKLYYSWKGKAFERIIQKHALEIAERIGFGLVVKSFGSYFLRAEKSPQIDLVYLRTDKTLTICEIKYSENPIQLTQSLRDQISQQRGFLTNQFPGKRIEHYLITNARVTEAVTQSDLFQRVINFFDLT